MKNGSLSYRISIQQGDSEIDTLCLTSREVRTATLLWLEGWTRFLLGHRFLIIDRDGKYCPAFIDLIKDAGTRPVRCPAKAPNCNAYAERFVRSIKYECLNKKIFFGVGSLEQAISNYLAHYHNERNHQGLENEIISQEPVLVGSGGEVRCRERLGGMLRFYHRKAA